MSCLFGRSAGCQSTARNSAVLLWVLLVLGVSGLARSVSAESAASAAPLESAVHAESAAHAARPATAVFAGGCFWCTESDFEKLPGVIKAVSGYAGGRVIRPSYEAVSAGGTGHAEAVRVTYDPGRVSYAQLVEFYWRTVDPTVRDQQFCDHGSQYRTVIFYATPAEKLIAEKSRNALLQRHAVPVIHTQIVPAGPFYVAEDYHQDYYKKNPLRYRYYRSNCGRDARLEQIWGASTH